MARFIALASNYTPLYKSTDDISNNNSKSKKSEKKTGMEELMESVRGNNFSSFVELLSRHRDGGPSHHQLHRACPAVLLLTSSSFYTAVAPWIVTDDRRGLTGEEITFFQEIPTFRYCTSLAICRQTGSSEKFLDKIQSALEILKDQLSRLTINALPLHPFVVKSLLVTPNLRNLTINDTPDSESVQMLLLVGLTMLLRQHANQHLHSALGENIYRNIFKHIASPRFCDMMNFLVHKEKLLVKLQKRMLEACSTDFTLLPGFLTGIQALIKLGNTSRLFRDQGDLDSENGSSSSDEDADLIFEEGAGNHGLRTLPNQNNNNNNNNQRPTRHVITAADRARIDRENDFLGDKDAKAQARDIDPIEAFNPTLELVEAIVQNGDFVKNFVKSCNFEIVETISLLTEYHRTARGIARNRKFMDLYGCTLLPQILEASSNFASLDDADHLGPAFIGCLEIYAFVCRDANWATNPSYPDTRDGMIAMMSAGRRPLSHFPFDHFRKALNRVLDENMTLTPPRLFSLGVPLHGLISYVRHSEFPVEYEIKNGVLINENANNNNNNNQEIVLKKIPLIIESGCIPIFIKILLVQHRDIVDPQHLKQLIVILSLHVLPVPAQKVVVQLIEKPFGSKEDGEVSSFEMKTNLTVRDQDDDVPLGARDDHGINICPRFDREMGLSLFRSGAASDICDFAAWWIETSKRKLETAHQKLKQYYDKKKGEEAAKNKTGEDSAPGKNNNNHNHRDSTAKSGLDNLMSALFSSLLPGLDVGNNNNEEEERTEEEKRLRSEYDDTLNEVMEFVPQLLVAIDRLHVLLVNSFLKTKEKILVCIQEAKSLTAFLGKLLSVNDTIKKFMHEVHEAFHVWKELSDVETDDDDDHYHHHDDDDDDDDDDDERDELEIGEMDEFEDDDEFGWHDGAGDEEDDDGDRLVDPFMLMLSPEERRRRGALPGRLVIGDEDDEENNSVSESDEDEEDFDQVIDVFAPNNRHRRNQQPVILSSGTRRTRGGRAVQQQQEQQQPRRSSTSSQKSNKTKNSAKNTRPSKTHQTTSKKSSRQQKSKTAKKETSKKSKDTSKNAVAKAGKKKTAKTANKKNDKVKRQSKEQNKKNNNNKKQRK